MVFVAKLWQVVGHCNFGTALNCMLRDCLVCGICGKSLWQHILVGENLMLDTALEAASTAEAAECKAAELQKGHVEGCSSGTRERHYKLSEVLYEKRQTGN